MRITSSLAVLVAAILGAPTASAQVFHVEPLEKPQSRVFLGVGAEFGVPQRDFADSVGHSWGVGGSFIYALDRAGIFGLRLDMNYLRYGHERDRVPLSATIGDRILVDVATDNNIFLASVGPQVLLPRGPFMPYLTGSIGVAYFFTQSSVEGASDALPFATTTNFGDASFAWSGAGGVYIALKQGARPISLDLGARYQSNGEVQYLRRGSITDNPDGTISFTPTRSQANMIIYHLGLVFGL